jgi:hypothetical protein
MLIYNITFSIEESTENEFIAFLKNELIPYIEVQNLTSSVTLLKLLTEIQQELTNLALQLNFEEIENYISFETVFLTKIIEKTDLKFKAKYLTFNTLLEKI